MQHLVVIYFFIRTNISRTTRLKLAKNKNKFRKFGDWEVQKQKIVKRLFIFFQPFNYQYSHHYRNQSVDLLCNSTAIYMMGTLVVKGLKIDLQDIDQAYICYISLTEATMRSQKLRLTCRELPSSCTPCEYQSELITSAVFFAVST